MTSHQEIVPEKGTTMLEEIFDNEVSSKITKIKITREFVDIRNGVRNVPKERACKDVSPKEDSNQNLKRKVKRGKTSEEVDCWVEPGGSPVKTVKLQSTKENRNKDVGEQSQGVEAGSADEEKKNSKEYLPGAEIISKKEKARKSQLKNMTTVNGLTRITQMRSKLQNGQKVQEIPQPIKNLSPWKKYWMRMKK